MDDQEYLSKSEIKSHRYNLKIYDLLSKQKYDEALKLFNDMPEEDIEQNENSFSYAIAACAAKNDEEGMNKYIDLMKKNYFKPDSNTYTIIIRILSEKGDLQAAEKIYEKMLELHLEPSSNTFNHILKRCAQENKLAKMRNWFRKMLKKGVPADAMTAFIMIKGHYDAGDYDGVESWYDYMENVKAPFDSQTYSLILSTKSVQGKVEELLKIRNIMKEAKIKLDLDCYYIIMATFVMKGSKEQVEDIRKGMLEDNFSIHDLLKYISTNYGKEKADDFEKMLKNPGSTQYVQETPKPKKLFTVFDTNWENLIEDPNGINLVSKKQIMQKLTNSKIKFNQLDDKEKLFNLLKETDFIWKKRSINQVSQENKK
eukprot:TRINITY_DN16968_c0_g1_i1.p1 TRINITY_DN16968_c0_g1~~TRINITY_DN16968_c0_g1_i1.p1  ORF type:complete len:429 (+),score=134.11 TRINITY_DN16968_c0_g1_i1:179-1288(+)